MNLWWSSWEAFWAMGGQSYFVWMSYGALLAAVVATAPGRFAEMR